MSFQTILIAGHLGRDPEMRYTPAGQAVTNFNLAANRQYTDSGGQVVKETTWFRVSAWGKTAENCNQYLRKGSLVLVEGRLVMRPGDGRPTALHPPGWLTRLVLRSERQHGPFSVWPGR